MTTRVPTVIPEAALDTVSRTDSPGALFAAPVDGAAGEPEQRETGEYSNTWMAVVTLTLTLAALAIIDGLLLHNWIW
ncbi:MAG: hypothetical protein JWN95_404 [Frankiales bacterium]|nr:hypothetical protein [Frankiales bacterium]